MISKAIRRRKLHPEMDALVFPEISLGVPKPIQDSSVDELVGYSFNQLEFLHSD